MDVNDFVKLVLALSGSISMLVISIQLGKFFGTMSDTLRQLQVTIDNLNRLTEQVLEDYVYVRETVESVGRMVNKVELYLVDPVAVGVSYVKEIVASLPEMILNRNKE